MDATTNTDVAPDGYTPAAADVGNLIQITTTGTGAAFTVGFYEIASIQSGKWRLDRSPAAVNSAGATWAMGGALATPGKAAGAVVASNIVYVKYSATAYLIAAGTVNTAGNKVGLTVGGTAGGAAMWWVGYDTTRTLQNTDANRPTLKANANSVGNLFATLANSNTNVSNLILDCNRANFTGANGLNVSACIVRNCWAKGGSNSHLISAGGGSLLLGCEASDGSLSGGNYGISLTASTAVGCVSHDHASSTAAFGIQNACVVQNCIAYASPTGFSTGNNANNGVFVARNCVAYSCTGDGFFVNLTASGTAFFVNCVATNNGGYGFNSSQSSATSGHTLYYCAGFTNTSNNVNQFANSIGFVTLTAGPFTAPGSGDFSLNSTAGGGAALRAAGFPGTYPLGLTTGYLDIGAAQSRGGGGGRVVGSSIVLAGGGIGV